MSKDQPNNQISKIFKCTGDVIDPSLPVGDNSDLKPLFRLAKSDQPFKLFLSGLASSPGIINIHLETVGELGESLENQVGGKAVGLGSSLLLLMLLPGQEWRLS